MTEPLSHRLRVLVVLVTVQFAMLVWYGAASEVTVLGVITGPQSQPLMYAFSAIAIGWVLIRWFADWQLRIPTLVFAPEDAPNSPTRLAAQHDSEATHDDQALTAVRTDGGRLTPSDD